MHPSAQHLAQYHAATTFVALHARDDRGLIEVVGKDRAGWLNNLITNVVKTLRPGEGNYAFACNVKGRCVFDLNVLVLPEIIWLDVDIRQFAPAFAHLNRYLVTEDVRLSDITPQYARCAVLGPKSHEVIARLGLGNLVPMAQLQHVAGSIGGTDVRMIRHDFVGLPAAEFIMPRDAGDAIVHALDAASANLASPSAAEAASASGGGGAASSSVIPRIDRAAIEMLRIEAGRPRSVDDIDEDVVPPETMQVERGISYHKGCYLGQEVIERMRSHGVLARRMVGIRLDADAAPAKNALVRTGGKDIGRVTSAAWSPALNTVLALGYVKSIHATAGTRVSVATDAASKQTEANQATANHAVANDATELSGEIVNLPVHQ